MCLNSGHGHCAVSFLFPVVCNDLQKTDDADWVEVGSNERVNSAQSFPCVGVRNQTFLTKLNLGMTAQFAPAPATQPSQDRAYVGD